VQRATVAVTAPRGQPLPTIADAGRERIEMFVAIGAPIGTR
jgi:hypothetical protein